MFDIIKRTWARSIAVTEFREAMRENDLISARKHYLKFQESSFPRYVAMGARLHLMERNFDKAKELLEHAIEIAEKKKRRKNLYVIEYCRYHLARLNGDKDAEDIWLNAHKMNPSERLFDSLPLYRSDKFEDRNFVKAKREAELSTSKSN
ncbi:MAG: hypothetical protein Pars2KO_00940 [Parasphingorhabdus sp.]